MSAFKAFLIEQHEDQFTRSIVDRDDADLPDGDVLIDVRFSSLNYKDGLSAIGTRAVTRSFPHTPGIDAAGLVLESSSDTFNVGDEVIVIGFDLGMNTPGGFGQHIRVPSGWVVPRPLGLSLEESMILGTAGFTAALCLEKLEMVGLNPSLGPVLITGSSGGVGSVAVCLLSQLGYEVHAATGKDDQYDFLKGIGATKILTRAEVSEGTERPMLKERWGAAIDTVGGDILFNAVKSLRYGSSLAACGLVASPDIPATVLPFILRNVNLLGIDSVQLPIERKAEIWKKLSTTWRIGKLELLKHELRLETLPDAIDRILAGEMVGRGLVRLES